MTPEEQSAVEELRAQRDAAIDEMASLGAQLKQSKEALAAVMEHCQVLADESSELQDKLEAATVLLQSKPAAPPAAQPWTGDSPCAKPHIERRRLAGECRSDTIKIRIGDRPVTFCEKCGQALPGGATEAYVHVLFYPDDTVGAFFVTLDKRKDGDMAAVGFSLLGRLCSRAIQMGVPANDIAETLTHQFDEAGGWVMQEMADGTLESHPEYGYVNGFSDLLGRVLAKAIKDGPRGGGTTP